MIDNAHDLLCRLKQYREIILYGAGNTARKILPWLEKNNVKVAYIMETKASAEHLGQYRLCSVTEHPVDCTMPVLIAVTEAYREMLEGVLQAEGYSHILTITDDCITRIGSEMRTMLQFQTHLVEHCNLKCRGCYHFSSLADEEYLTLEEFEQDIARLSQLFDGEAEEILLLGGEPLLHPRLNRFFEITRNYFSRGCIKLLSNGLLLPKMKEDFFAAIRENKVELWITKYPVNFDYDRAETYALQNGVDIHYFNREPVRTLGHQPLDVEGAQNATVNWHSCYRANLCVDLKHGKMFPCIVPAEIKPFCAYFNQELEVTTDDYVDIYSVGSGQELLERLKKPIPFCRYCNRASIEKFGTVPWSRTKFEMLEWTE